MGKPSQFIYQQLSSIPQTTLKLKQTNKQKFFYMEKTYLENTYRYVY